jgi:D-glycero-D-manno-heptose 1,7-bisphosphate phosphatase
VSAPRIRHVILDRDGVLNREAHDGGYVLVPAEFDWLPGALAALALLRQAGVRITVATNQSAVGRGLMSPEQLESVHAKMRLEAAEYGGALDDVLFCPHAPEAQCDCRKPAPRLLLEAVNRSGIAGEETLVVGDDHRDLEAAARAGLSSALVLTGKGRATRAQLMRQGIATPAYDDLLQLAVAVANSAVQRQGS